MLGALFALDRLSIMADNVQKGIIYNKPIKIQYSFWWNIAEHFWVIVAIMNKLYATEITLYPEHVSGYNRAVI